VLEPGGRLLAVDFSAPSALTGGLIARLHRHGGVSVDAMVTLLRESGMRVVETGSVGVSDLQYVVAVAPMVGERPLTDDTVSVARSLPPLAPPRWLVPSLVLTAVIAHLLVARRAAAHLTLSAAGTVALALLLAVVALHLSGVRRARNKR
jgi:hypothetical protein